MIIFHENLLFKNQVQVQLDGRHQNFIIFFLPNFTLLILYLKHLYLLMRWSNYAYLYGATYIT